LIPAQTRHKGISVVSNVLWIILAGIWIAIAHLISGCLLCLTVIGIPLGVANFKFAGAALAPFGKEIVNNSDLGKVGEEGQAVSVPG
jgi:uncharacterized membrane protein YccF (DUF307 family)